MALTTITSGMLPADIISDHTNIGAQPAGSDEVLLSDAGVLKAVTVDNLIAGAGGGITHASQWRLTTNFDGDKAPIDGNLEEVDAPSGFGILGSSMTESSGVFTFPSTGYWLVRFDAMYYYTNDSTYADSQIYVTIDDGGDWGIVTYARSGTGGSDFANPSSVYIVDVTDTSNVKVRFHVKTEDDSATCKGDTGYNYTYMTFIRLGDT